MSRSFYKVTEGLAQIITTGEPVFVKSVTNHIANVTRAVVTPDGIVYRDEEFPINQLETRFDMVKRGVELEQFVSDLREKAQAKKFAMPEELHKALAAVKQPVQTYRNANGREVNIQG